MCLEEELEKATGTKQLHTPHSIRDPFEHELHTKGIVLEVDGPQHFYRDSFHWTSSSKLKHRLLTRLGFRVVHVPYFDWLKLHTQNLRRAYLQ
ncbi:rap domain-containing protein [Cystoisospora suis]|uniref:Rap domain-containing protein n=1 Tax=Cystoisospora suis TaxID=483139 RepID=A0A2C6LCM1_9APIC|nr:rap domain-containing protein [Cystoisospora suis]